MNTQRGISGGQRLLKLSDASRRLGVSYQTLFLAVSAGRVPAERNATGSRWLIAEADLGTIAAALGIEAAGDGVEHARA